MEIFVGCWRREVVTRTAGPSRADTQWLCDKVNDGQGGRPTQTKKRFSTALCRKTVPSVTLRYFQPHFRTGITTVSTVPYLTTKDHSDKSQGPLRLKIVLLTTVNARGFLLLSAERLELFMPTATCIRSPPPLLAASLRCVKRKARVLSAATCPTLFTWPSEPELPTTSSLPLALWALIHFSLSLWLPGEALNARELSHASS